jgi:hypothetical protein
MLLRDLAAAPIIILVITSGVTAATLFTLLYFQTEILGPDGKWILKSLYSYVHMLLKQHAGSSTR